MTPRVSPSGSVSDSPRVVLGSGRSGTTWVLDALAEANGLRTVFEPLHPAESAAGRRYTLRYLRAETSAPGLAEWLAPVLRGERTPVWPTVRVRRDHLFGVRHPRRVYGNVVRLLERVPRFVRERRLPVLTKLIRANLMLPWLARQLGARMVLVLRHPAAVLASKRRLIGPEWKFEPWLAQFLADAPLCEDFLEPHRETLSKPLGEAAGQTAVWCIENGVAMRAARELGVAVVSYERLLAGDPDEWERTRSALALERVPERALRERPSQQVARDHVAERFEAGAGARWRASTSEDDLREIQDMLDRFEIACYRAREPAPCGPASPGG